MLPSRCLLVCAVSLNPFALARAHQRYPAMLAHRSWRAAI